MAETGQSLMDLGGAEGEDLFNRTMRTEKEKVAAKKAEVAVKKSADAKSPPAEAQTAKSDADSAAVTSASGGETARERLEAAWEEWAGDEKLPKWADGLDEAHLAEYARLVKAASDTHSETSSLNRPEKLALDRFEESHGMSFRPAAKPTEKERVAAKKAEVAEGERRGGWVADGGYAALVPCATGEGWIGGERFNGGFGIVGFHDEFSFQVLATKNTKVTKRHGRS